MSDQEPKKLNMDAVLVIRTTRSDGIALKMQRTVEEDEDGKPIEVFEILKGFREFNIPLVPIDNLERIWVNTPNGFKDVTPESIGCDIVMIDTKSGTWGPIARYLNNAGFRVVHIPSPKMKDILAEDEGEFTNARYYELIPEKHRGYFAEVDKENRRYKIKSNIRRAIFLGTNFLSEKIPEIEKLTLGVPGVKPVRASR